MSIMPFMFTGPFCFIIVYIYFFLWEIMRSPDEKIINSYMKFFIERKLDYAVELIRSIDLDTDTSINTNFNNQSVTKFSLVNSPDYAIYKMLSQANSSQEIYDDIQRLRRSKI